MTEQVRLSERKDKAGEMHVLGPESLELPGRRQGLHSWALVTVRGESGAPALVNPELRENLEHLHRGTKTKMKEHKVAGWSNWTVSPRNPGRAGDPCCPYGPARTLRCNVGL